MKIQLQNNVDSRIATISKSIANNLENNAKFVSDKTDTATNVTVLQPPVPFKDCEYVFLNSSFVAKCARVKAGDVALNKITLTTNDDSYDSIIPAIEKNIAKNQTEIYNMLVDYYYAGLGILEYAYNETDFMLRQIPVNTCRIIIVSFDKQQCYLLEQKIQSKTNYFKIMGEKYPENFTTYNKQTLGDVCLLGGDNLYEFFSVPLWVQEKDKIFTEIAIGSRNYNTISNGNLATGVLHINLEPQLINQQSFDEEGNPVKELSREEIISDELMQTDSGIAVIFTESNRDSNFDFIKIENDNYSYLESQQEKAETATLNCYNIPLARLMINTEKESMNSNKTQSIWEIYTLDLQTEQVKVKDIIADLIYDLYSIEVDVDIEVPIFSDRREIEINNLINEWNNGLLTLKQTITGLAEYTSVINLAEYDFTINPELWDYRKLDGYYDILNEDNLIKLDEIESEINEIKYL